MYSYLQYRNFRRNLQEQIERHGRGKVEKSCTKASIKEGSIRDREQRVFGVFASRDNALEEKELENETPRSKDEGIHGVDDSRKTLEKSIPREETNSTPNTTVQPLPGRRSSLKETSLDEIEDDEATTSEMKEAILPIASKDLSDPSSNDDNSLTSTSTDVLEHPLEAIPTRGTVGTTLATTLTGIEVRDHRRCHEPDHETNHIFVVGYQGPHDPMNPHNWTMARRILVTGIVSMVGFIVGFASSIDSTVIPQAQAEFGVSEVTESLATGIFLICFGFGAFFAAPISETVGRIPVYLVTMFFFTVFLMACALAPNIGGQLVLRGIAGLFGATPLVVSGGSLSDIWSPTERTAGFPLFANTAFWGPVLGPVIGGFIGQSSHVSWRWVEWVSTIISGLTLAMIFFFMPETYAPVLLKWKATHLRSITGDQRYLSALEIQDTKLIPRLIHNMYRPFFFIIYEPIAILFTLYLTVVYIVLFTFLTGFEFIFAETYQLSQGLTYLPFLAILLGFNLTSVLIPFLYRSYTRALRSSPTSRLPPETRLMYAMIGAPFLPIGLFWMAWTSSPGISVWSPIAACVPIGFGILGIFITTYQYLIDTFETYAASALVGAVFVRYVVAGCMVPVSIPFYRNVGVHWTLTILGAIAAVMAPVPFVFWKFGPAIRRKSRHATDFA